MDFFIFGRAFGRVFGILPYTDGFFASIFDSFLPQIADCQGKNLKKLKVQKWCQNASNSII